MAIAATATTDAQRSNHTPTEGVLPWAVCLTAALFFFYEFIQLNMFNAIDPELMREFNIHATELGHLFAFYLYANVVFLFPAGMILDRISTRKLILTAMTVCVSSTFLFAMATALWEAQLARFLTGIGSAFCFLSCLRLASRWFPPQRMALITGLIVTMAMLGGVVAQAPLTWMVEHVGWRHALFINGSFGITLIVIIALVVRDYPKQQAHLQQQRLQKVSEIGVLKSINMALANPQNWLGGIYTCLLNLPIFIFGAVWGSLYLTQAHGISRIDATYITTMIFIGTIVGSPTFGALSDKIARRRSPMIFGAITSIITILAIMYLPNPSFNTLMALFFALGFFTSTQVISYPLITESNSRALTGTAAGFSSVLIMSGGAIFPPLFGWLMDQTWSGETLNGVAIYSQHDYYYALLILPISFAVSLLAALITKETYCRAKE